MQQYLLFLTLIWSGIFSASAQSLQFYQIEDLSEYQQALEKAIDEEKILFAVIFEEDGEFENMIRAGVFEHDSLKKAYNQKTIPIAIRINSSMGSRMMESFGSTELPAFYYLTTEEMLSLVKSGTFTDKQLLQALEEAVQNQRQFDILRKKYASNELSQAEWVQLLEFFEMNFDFERTKDLAFEFLARFSEEQLLQPEVKPILLSYGLDLGTPYPGFIIKHKESFPDSLYQDFYQSAYSYNYDLAVENEDTVLFQKILDQLIPASPEPDSLKDELAFESQKVFAYESGLFSVWQKAALEQGQKMETDSARAEFIFKQGFEIADNYNSKNAQKAARQLAQRAFQLRPDFRYKMLEAYMAYLMEDYDEAEKLVNEASANTEESQNKDKAERLRKMIHNEQE